MKNLLNKITGIFLAIVAIVTWCIYSYKMGEENSIAANAGIISNTKISWGVKRNQDHKQPELGKTNVSLMEKYERNIHGEQIKAICIFNI